jgi:hypothetical protein
MSKEKPGDDPRQRTDDQESTKQTNKPWKGPVEKEQRSDGAPKPDLEKWHDTNTH